MKTLILLLLIVPLSIFAVQVPFSQQMIKTDANHISGMNRISPPDNLPIDQKTDTWFWHDGKSLYVYWELEIDDQFYPGAFATRDDTQQCDYIRIQVKTIANEDYAYYFSAYPRGASYDGVRNENMGVDKAWNSLYYCESNYNDKLWCCTMIIPFKDLRYEGKPPYRWTFSTARQINASNTIYSYPYVPVTGKTVKQYYDSFSVLEIKESIDPPKNITIIPYLYKSYDWLNETQSFDPKHIGLNMIYRPSKNTSCKFALNPDFTETPPDEEIDTHNSKYAPQLIENRLLFTEDMNAFGVTSSLFYSRNIMQPQYAAKVTSSGSDWSFGLLSARDEETLNADSTVANPDDYYNILAFKKYNGNISNQFTYLNRFNDKNKKNNHVFFWAPKWNISPSFYIFPQIAYIFTDVPYRSQKQGSNVKLDITKRFGRLAMSATLSDVTKDYYADMGIQSDVNISGLNTSIDYDQAFSGTYLKSYHVGLYCDEFHQRNGDYKLINNDITLQANVDFFQNYSIASFFTAGKERMYDQLKFSWVEDLNLSWSKWVFLSGNIGYKYGDNLYRTLCATLPYQVVYGGVNGYLGPVVSYNIRNSHVIWYDLLSFPISVPVHFDNEYDITNLDFKLTFSNSFKISSGVRYNNYEYFAQTKHLGYFATMHWLYNPSTTFYLGFKTTEDNLLDSNQSTESLIVFSNQTTSKTTWFKINKVF